MCDLSKRQLEFIRKMLKENEYRPILYFANKLSVSDKTLKEDLKGIRTYLKQYQVKIIAKTGRGILMESSAKNNIHILNDLNLERKEMKKDSSEARRASILKNLLVYSNKNTSMQKLSELYYVSKASIVNDMKYIEQWLERFSLTLGRSNEGTSIKGSEKNIRKAIAGLIEECRPENTSENKKIEFEGIIRLDETTLNGLLELFDFEEIIYVESLLSDMELKSDKNISDIYYVNLLTHILICLKRVNEGIVLEEAKAGKMIRTDTIKQYDQACRIAQMIEEKYGIVIGEAEKYYIYQYLASVGMEGAVESESNREEDDCYKIATALTAYITDVLKVDFQREQKLLDGLLLHIRPMLNRLEYNIQINNPLLGQMQRSYPQMLGICRIAIHLLSEKYNLQEISIDEIANIATYYQTMILKLTEPKKVLVVCHSGYGTSQLLAEKLKHEFSVLHIVDVVSLRKAEHMELTDIDYIISTIPIPIKNIKYILISALLTEQDISDIRNSIYINMSDEKKQKTYLRHIKKLLKEQNIYMKGDMEGENAVRKNVTDKKLFKTEMSKDMIVCLEKPETEDVIRLFVDGNRNRITFYLAAKDYVLKEVLSDIYNLSVKNEDIQALIRCNSKGEVIDFLEKRA